VSDCIVKVGVPDGGGGTLNVYTVPNGKNFLLKYAKAHATHGTLRINGVIFLTDGDEMELGTPASFPPGTLFTCSNTLAGYEYGVKIIGIEEDRRVTLARNRQSN
jgi:hypothetical protein